jgi:hypothetical protein
MELPNEGGKGFMFAGSTAATRGYMVGWGTSTSAAPATDTDFATGAVFIVPGDGLYQNDGSGYGSAPSWTALDGG